MGKKQLMMAFESRRSKGNNTKCKKATKILAAAAPILWSQASLRYYYCCKEEDDDLAKARRKKEQQWMGWATVENHGNTRFVHPFQEKQNDNKSTKRK